MAYIANSSVAGLPEFIERAKVPSGGYDFLGKFKNLYNQFGAGNLGYGQPTTANVGAAQINPINLPEAYNEDPYQFKSVDPASAINAAKAPIESQKQREFAEAGARYGAGGGLQSSSYAEFGLGKASARAAENIASMTEQALYDASKFNTEMEAQMENARRGRQFSGWQARGGWDVQGQMDTEGRRLGARGQDVSLAIANADAANRLKMQFGMDPGAIMSLLGMDENQAWKRFNAENMLNQQGYESRMGMGSLLSGMPASQANIMSNYLGAPVNIPGLADLFYKPTGSTVTPRTVGKQPGRGGIDLGQLGGR